MIHELDLLEPTGENLRTGEEQVDRICQRSCKKEGESLMSIYRGSVIELGLPPENRTTLNARLL